MRETTVVKAAALVQFRDDCDEWAKTLRAERETYPIVDLKFHLKKRDGSGTGFDEDWTMPIDIALQMIAAAREEAVAELAALGIEA